MKFRFPFIKSASSQIQQLNLETVYEWFQNPPADLIFLDVRRPEEWQEGVIPGALKLSLSDLRKQQKTLDKSKTYLLVCRSGNRSQMAAKALEAEGFEHLNNFQGGMMAWYSHNYPLSK